MRTPTAPTMPAARRAKRSRAARPPVARAWLAWGRRAPITGLITCGGMRVKMSAAPRRPTCAFVPPMRPARTTPPLASVWAQTIETRTGPAERRASPAEDGAPGEPPLRFRAAHEARRDDAAARERLGADHRDQNRPREPQRLSDGERRPWPLGGPDAGRAHGPHARRPRQHAR